MRGRMLMMMVIMMLRVVIAMMIMARVMTGEGELHKNCSTAICSPDPHQCGKHQYPEI